MNGPVALTQRTVLGVLAAVAVIAGSLGPWQKVLFVSVSGVDGGGDGVLTLVMGCVAGALVVRGRSPIAVFWLGAAIAVVGFFAYTDAAAWGLFAVIGGGVGLVVWGSQQVALRRTDDAERQNPRQPVG